MRKSFKYLSPVLVTGLLIFSILLATHWAHPGHRAHIKCDVIPTSYSVYKDMLRFLIPAIKS
jgi:hypothetical protein